MVSSSEGDSRLSAAADIVICNDIASIATDAAYRFSTMAAESVRARGRFTVALSGGKTPAALHRLLAGEPFRSAVDWTAVHLFFGDERAVPRDNEISNYRMASETLLQSLQLPEAQVHPVRTEAGSPEEAARQYEVELRSLFPDQEAPRFDLVLLGMGPDGHCASLFPHSAALQETGRWVCANPPGMQPLVPRVTLTLPALNGAANVLFLVAGADKAEMAVRVLNGPSDPDALPSQAVRPPNGTLTWLMDRAAAKLI